MSGQLFPALVQIGILTVCENLVILEMTQFTPLLCIVLSKLTNLKLELEHDIILILQNAIRKLDR